MKSHAMASAALPAATPSKPRRPARGRSGGFTLIEMVTTMSVLAVLLAVTSPGLASLTTANALSGLQSELTSAMVLARSEAIKRGTPVGVASLSPVRGAEFDNGWVVFVDADGNGRYDTGETVIRQRAALSSDVRIATSGATTVTFTSRGFLATPALVDFLVCPSAAVGTGPAKGYRLRLEPVGLSDVVDIATCT